MCWRPVSKPSDWNMRLREVTSQALAGISSSQWSYEGEGPTRGKVPRGARSHKALTGTRGHENISVVFLPTYIFQHQDRAAETAAL